MLFLSHLVLNFITALRTHPGAASVYIFLGITTKSVGPTRKGAKLFSSNINAAKLHHHGWEKELFGLGTVDTNLGLGAGKYKF